MDKAQEQRIRLRAYEIWLAAGMNDGDAERHWLHAERAVCQESELPSIAKGNTVEPAARKRAASKDAKAKLVGAKLVDAKAATAKAATAKTAKAKTPKAKTGAAKRAATKAVVSRRPKAPLGSAADAVA